MRITRLFFIFAAVVLASVCPLSTVVAQMPPYEYRFLDLKVVDASGAPVADATVVSDRRASEAKSKTNRSGRWTGEFYLPYRSRVEWLNFSILKPGYFPFIDYFGTINRPEKPITIELLKIPETRAERKAVGREQLKRELFGAAKTGDAAAVRRLLQTGVSPNVTTTDLRGVPVEKGVPAVVYAARTGSGATVSAFVRAGSIVRRRSEPTRSILKTYLAVPTYIRYIAKADKTDSLTRFETGAEDLIRAGADVNPPDAQKTTTLMLAAGQNSVRLVRLLIEKGVPVNARSDSQMTALMYAASSADGTALSLDTIKLLLKSGADINAATVDNNGNYYSCQTALKFAVWSGSARAIELLIKNGAAVNSTCKGGRTALEIAKLPAYGEKAVGMEKIIKLLEAAAAK